MSKQTQVKELTEKLKAAGVQLKFDVLFKDTSVDVTGVLKTSQSPWRFFSSQSYSYCFAVKQFANPTPKELTAYCWQQIPRYAFKQTPFLSLESMTSWVVVPIVVCDQLSDETKHWLEKQRNYVYKRIYLIPVVLTNEGQHMYLKNPMLFGWQAEPYLEFVHSILDGPARQEPK